MSNPILFLVDNVLHIAEVESTAEAFRAKAPCIVNITKVNNGRRVDMVPVVDPLMSTGDIWVSYSPTKITLVDTCLAPWVINTWTQLTTARPEIQPVGVPVARPVSPTAAPLSHDAPSAPAAPTALPVHRIF